MARNRQDAGETLVIYDAAGAARMVDKSEGWGRFNFKSGVLPTEVLINGKRPAITDATLQRLAPQLKATGRQP